MKFLKIILILFLFLTIAPQVFSQTKIMSYNIRYDTQNDGDNWWNLRKDEVVELLKYYSPHFIGIQEAMPNQIKFMANNLEQYEYVGHGRDGEGTNSEATPIFYKSDSFELLESKTLWLSETPQQVSKGWDAALNRIVLHGTFKNKASKEIIHIINTHFDHIGELARQKSAELIVEYLKSNELKDEKIIFMGDLNSLPSESPIILIEKEFRNSYKSTKLSAYGPKGTFNGFDPTKAVTRQIDYIFTKNIDVLSYRCIDDRRKNNLYPSDHFPVLINISSAM